VKEFDPASRFGKKTARHMDRFVQFAVAATEEALEDSSLSITDSNRDRIGVIIGTGIGGVSTLEKQTATLRKSGPKRVSPFMVPMMLPDTAAGQVAINFGVRGPNLCITSACASSTNALGEAAEIIRRGSADIVIAGGAEAAITPVTIAAFANMGALSSRNDDPTSACRPFDRDRDGFVAGEGAAILLLESEQHAIERGATIYGEIAGYGLSNDAHHITAPASDGAAAIISMQLAIHDSKLKSREINYINAHGTSTPLNDKTETLAIKQVFGEHAYEIPISSTKSMHGHLLGAAGALEAIMCVQSLVHGIIPPTINQFTSDPECDLDYVANNSRKLAATAIMSNSFGFGGHNASLVFTKYKANNQSTLNA
jgi:3-oxoacyl-[acyl-carrier-protein] synthase II